MSRVILDRSLIDYRETDRGRSRKRLILSLLRILRILLFSFRKFSEMRMGSTPRMVRLLRLSMIRPGSTLISCESLLPEGVEITLRRIELFWRNY